MLLSYGMETKPYRMARAARVNPKEYWIWCSMRKRCNSPNDKDYRYYGERGIKVCERWDNFGTFLNDMGEKPEGMTLERLDCDGDYCPENCIWADRKTQARNSSRAHRYTHSGETKPLKEWCELFGVNYFVAYSRLRSGWTFNESLEVK